ncbi:alpha/beta hydrolase [Devosia rhodophyticola]|uniref:Alpha/beta hydrolase n=1 Tax=Devosia rhodophyticola TaxID=3026423 RepID=A0ABY7YVC7_9HYPH|nr:alpha/beta hydrolase [Devosia rhodophyticola]WDR04815.1 alpha/beta hydrolase [Devosia rhodophyticola]
MSHYHFREGKGRDIKAPVLFLFHGTGGDENQFFDLGVQLMAGARVIAVRGDVSEQGALRYFKRTGEGVYDMADLATRTQALSAFVRERLTEGEASAVVGLGYSNGANILAAMQFENPDLFGASVLMHPLIPFAPKPQPGLAGREVLITAGRQDQICPAEATERLGDYFRVQGSQTEIYYHAGGHEIVATEIGRIQQFLSHYSVLTA